MITKTTIKNDNDGKLFAQIDLRTIHHDGRDVAFSVSPDNNDGSSSSPSVLFHYPGGGNRRMILSFRMLFADLRFICVNRPGKGGTSPSDDKGAAGHLRTSVDDAVAVLDELGVDKVSLVSMCAGTPFCLAFAARYPDRTTGQLVGISSWVQPADCGYANTKTSLFLGSRMPTVVSPVAGLVFSSIGSSLTSFPPGMVLGALRSKLSTQERTAFDEKYNDASGFALMMKWMQQDCGGSASDMSVLLSAELVDYQAVVDSQESIVLWHGTNDSMVPYVSAQWLANQALAPGGTVVLHSVPDGTHEGCNFLLHSSIVDSLKALGLSQSK